MRWLGLLALIAGCNLYFQDQSGQPRQCDFTLCHGQQCTYVPCVDAGPAVISCIRDADCPSLAGVGSTMHCDLATGACISNASCDGPTCPAGSYCSTSHVCTATCLCGSNVDSAQEGYAYCDTNRHTCMPKVGPSGTCALDAPGCTGAPEMPIPTCAVGDVPVFDVDSCSLGCRHYDDCDVQPPCEYINDGLDCTSRTDCLAIYNIHTGAFASCTSR